MKNTTRLSSLMGTWTGLSTLKAKLGPYSITSYFVVHLMPDPNRGYGCSMNECSEFYNQACVQNNTEEEEQRECVDLGNSTLEWSDASAFFYFGAKVDAGIPFNIHVEHNTGGWVGPVNVILAKAPGDVSNNITDHYVVRYVDTPSTLLLHMPTNCTLMDNHDFDELFGSPAVVNTVQHQNGTTTNSSSADPYSDYLQTCSHGNVQAILPLLEFRFMQGDNNNSEEQLQVLMKYKILTVPHKKDIMYRVYPYLQSRLNQRNIPEFHVSGPYCYGDDPKRGYTFDVTYDSMQESDYMTLTHGCVENHKCLPPPAELLQQSEVKMITVHTKASIGGDILWMLVCMILLGLLGVSVFWNCRLMKKQRMVENRNNELAQPLLDDAQEEETEQDADETPPAEPPKREPQVAFV